MQAVVGYYQTENKEKEDELNKKLLQLYSFDLSNFEQHAKEEFSGRLASFYEQNDASKLPVKEQLVAHYFSREEELNGHLQAIYGAGLSPTPPSEGKK
jgi:hypothetical protein